MSSGKTLGLTYVINGKSADLSDFIPDMSADIYYEVIRLIDGKLLFLQDHLDRLKNSLAVSGRAFPGDESILENLRLLLAKNLFTMGNIRICLQPTVENRVDLLAYFVPYVYPETSMYKAGVCLLTYPYTRANPGIKKWDNRFRSSVGQYIREHGVYEAVLLNKNGQITEGSRSNLSFIDQQGCLVTVPEQHILPGITRKYVLRIAQENGIPILEKSISLESLDTFSSAFISGTSPKVLPVLKLDKTTFDVSHPLLQLLMREFDVLMQENLTSI